MQKKINDRRSVHTLAGGFAAHGTTAGSAAKAACVPRSCAINRVAWASVAFAFPSLFSHALQQQFKLLCIVVNKHVTLILVYIMQ